eukprot:gene2729-3371_t
MRATFALRRAVAANAWSLRISDAPSCVQALTGPLQITLARTPCRSVAFGKHCIGTAFPKHSCPVSAHDSSPLPSGPIAVTCVPTCAQLVWAQPCLLAPHPPACGRYVILISAAAMHEFTLALPAGAFRSDLTADGLPP